MLEKCETAPEQILILILLPKVNIIFSNNEEKRLWGKISTGKSGVTKKMVDLSELLISAVELLML